jgi:ABC-type cobalamin/Fe3+-siderophores transport system ATPase subunit
VSLLRATGLGGGYRERLVVSGVDLEIGEGRCTAVLGPNGSGKSTLLRLLAGVLPARMGQVELLGRPLASWRRREIAQRIGYVPQWVDFSFPLSVEEVVEQGRAPHLGPWRPASPRDRAAVRRALDRMGLGDRASTAVRQLSGGERQRVLLARALASEPRLLLLDEPATALDVRHQLELVDTVRGLLDEGVGTVLVVHDWNLALRLADHMLVLCDGRPVATGRPADIVTPGLFRAVFGVEVELLSRGGTGPDIVLPTGRL